MIRAPCARSSSTPAPWAQLLQSSSRIERGLQDDVAMRFLRGNPPSKSPRIAEFRRRHHPAPGNTLVQTVQLGRPAGLLRTVAVVLDPIGAGGTQVRLFEKGPGTAPGAATQTGQSPTGVAVALRRPQLQETDPGRSLPTTRDGARFGGQGTNVHPRCPRLPTSMGLRTAALERSGHGERRSRVGSAKRHTPCLAGTARQALWQEPTVRGTKVRPCRPQPRPGWPARPNRYPR